MSTAPVTARHIEWRQLDSLTGDPRNPKGHSLETIDDSMDRFGVVDIITEDGRTGFIISGHGRAQVLRDRRAAGEQPPEGVTTDEWGNWVVPVVVGWSSSNDAEAAAALISMNRTTELGGWVDQPLLDLLDEIAATPDQFDGVGFSETDLDDLRAQLEEQPAPDPDTDDDDGAGAGTSGRAVTIKLTDAGSIAHWHELRDNYKTDEQAYQVLAGLAVPTKRTRGRQRKSRVPDATVADVGVSTASPPVDKSGDGLDWSTAAMVMDPEDTGAELDPDFVLDLDALPDEL